MLRAIEASPKPVVLVFQDVGPRPSHSCHFGYGMATVASRLGAIGLVTDGGVRDLAGCRALGFHYFARGVTVSHGQHRIVDTGLPVKVSGVTVRPSDLLHADENGVVLIPLDVAPRVAVIAQAAEDEEREIMAFYRGERFSLEAMRAGRDGKDR